MKIPFLKKKGEKEREKEKEKEKKEVVSKKETFSKSKKERISQQEIGKILLSGYISEKATFLSEKNNQYIFKVAKGANKNQIKKAIESLYGVDVLSVRIVKIPPKQRRRGRVIGLKKGYKKAIVSIKKGQKISIL